MHIILEYYNPMAHHDTSIVLGGDALRGAFSAEDRNNLDLMHNYFAETTKDFEQLSVLGTSEPNQSARANIQQNLIASFERMGKAMQRIVAAENGRIQVDSFLRPRENHGEASRLIAKLRDSATGHEEFVYYIQRAYELLFNGAYGSDADTTENYRIVQTPVTHPVQNYAVHKLPNIDERVKNTVMCVLLRGALLPSMIISKEIQEYSTYNLVTPFALFRIKRNEARGHDDMEYLLNLESSYFDPAALHDKDLVFADPMNATGGTVVTVLHYLETIGVRPRSVTCFNVIAALQGALQIIRSVPNARVFTLWMDPVLNDKAYILPGLGDAGDRLNGRDGDENPRNIIQLIADYGSNISNLYRSQVRQIENTVLKRY